MTFSNNKHSILAKQFIKSIFTKNICDESELNAYFNKNFKAQLSNFTLKEFYKYLDTSLKRSISKRRYILVKTKGNFFNTVIYVTKSGSVSDIGLPPLVFDLH